MKWGIAAAVASAAAVAAASGAELLACDCADQPPQQQEAAAAAVGRCDAFLVRHNQVCLPDPLLLLPLSSSSISSDPLFSFWLVRVRRCQGTRNARRRRRRGSSVWRGRSSRRGSTASDSSRRSSRRTAELGLRFLPSFLP
ncbi:Os10g0161800 [Oryza sativa Japonica Group]|uniref:Os10g0161800 protein n=2 Tax=Oryza sativa subsp. japonica TaxID=39947 RepID=C7J798_ORYSJ|nr:hypothetical protein DAI22_10g031101 [Oryza sativa Japonica Group]BAH94765.1 Os10g0161800 [Oryza sativa Japonica Group]BAT09991.1 Os10g0161800 [Oryza sativa Japonica Group]|eukprot:NP_001176037.1 Os10g0161800 [Oryza sativa Japonica Group]